MKYPRLLSSLMAAALLLGLSSVGSVSAADYPAKSIKIILPYGAGGDTDLNARVTAKYLTKEMGQPVVVSNMTGASGTVASKFVKDAPGDGYTVMFNHNNILLHKLLGLADYSYESFAPAGMIVADEATGLVVPADSPFKTLQDLIAAAKAKPDEIIYATQAGAFTTLLGLVFEKRTGANLHIVDAGGAAEQITAMLGGQSQVSAFPYGLVKDQVAAGKMRYLCLFADERNPLLKDVPTAKEQGVDLTLTRRYGFYMPKNTPAAVVNAFAAALEKVSKNPEFIKDATGMFASPDYLNPEQSVEYLKGMEEAYKEFADAMRNAG